jgi:aspartyl-tRNA(Asn)/glutamyl-tRNA(Gln) amidotransferase subunit A
MTDLVELTLSDAVRALERGDASSAELVEATLAQIERTEPDVHAYARVLADEARAAAREADAERARGAVRSPVHGVPIGIKDIFLTKGVRTEGGSRVLAGFTPDHDAASVVRMAAAGTILMGKTATHEFAWGVNIPPTRSPWGEELYPGGSSTGSGVAVSVRSAYATLGSDTGGSVRIPSAINGIVGIKPTFGRISRYGVLPLAASLDHVGVLARCVEDCARLLEPLSGFDARDRGSIDEPVPDFRSELEAGVDGLTIGVERSHHFYEGVAPDVAAAVEAVIAEYARMGATIVEVELPEFEAMPAAGLTVMLAEGAAFHRRWLRERGDDYDPATRAMLELGELMPATHYVVAQQARTRFVARTREMFEENRLDALLAPTQPITTVPALELNVSKDGAPTPVGAIVHHTFAANVLGLPAISLPCGLSDEGLPIGLHLMGRPFEEPLLLRMARAYEREHDWPALRPPLLEGAA